jgi:GNAT superfamily N-acetyltransferase
MPLRRATPDDVDDLVRLRRVMFDAMDVDHSDPAWAEACARILREGLAGDRMAGYVVEEDRRVVACGVGILAQRLPGPRRPGGLNGHVQSMATEPAARGRGYAREIFAALLAWFDEAGADTVDLHATKYGEPLYRSFGFTEPRFVTLGWRRSP